MKKQYKHRYFSLLTGFLIFAFCASGEVKTDNPKQSQQTKPKEFKPSERVVVYYPWWSWDKWEDRESDMDKVTHINIAFANPDKDGNFFIKKFDNTKLAELVNEAHSKGVRVLISIGGGRGPDYSKFLNSDTVDTFCKKVMDFIDKYNLDGLDVDIEGKMIIEDDYKRFISKIYPLLKKEGKFLTAALGWSTRERIKKETLDKFDFINVMAYDETGAWNPNRPGQHSSVEWGKKNLDYWNKKGVEKDKLVLGVPFYGKHFTKDKKVISMKYREILEKHPNSHSKDKIGHLYFNGKPTIKEKSRIGRKYGGIMIWEITQDSNDEHSLLDVIHKDIKKKMIF